MDSYWETLMGILGRMSSVIKSNLNDLISKMEDPGKQVEQLKVDRVAHLQQFTQLSEEIIKAVG